MLTKQLLTRFTEAIFPSQPMHMNVERTRNTSLLAYSGYTLLSDQTINQPGGALPPNVLNRHPLGQIVREPVRRVLGAGSQR
jgi:hypothetical protein